MKSLKTNPGAKRLIESLRNMGYDCSTAIADLVDNSITANASEIHIEINAGQDSKPAHIIIADNGKGMNREELHEAMRFGAFQEYSADDLGKYGLGLKTASLSQCRTLTVASKAKSHQSEDTRPRRHCMRWDIDHVYETDDWDLLVPTESELESWEKEALGHSVVSEYGTVVLWTNLGEALPLLSVADAREKEKFMAHLIDETSNHLRMIFHRFMQGAVTGRRKLNIYVCGQQLTPWDPFCRNEETRELDILKMPVISVEPDGSKLKETMTISPFVLPREDEFSQTSAWKDASGPKGWNQQQGFYFYRNNRLLQAGGWSRLRSVDEHTKLLRIAVDFPSNLDKAFSINITKMRAKIPAEVRDIIGNHVSSWAKTARTRYDGKTASRQGNISKPDKSQTLTNARTEEIKSESVVNIGSFTFLQGNGSDKSLQILKNNKTEKTEVIIPEGEFPEIFSVENSKGEELKRLCATMIVLLEMVYERKIKPDNIPLKDFKKIYYRNL